METRLGRKLEPEDFVACHANIIGKRHPRSHTGHKSAKLISRITGFNEAHCVTYLSVLDAREELRLR